MWRLVEDTLGSGIAGPLAVAAAVSGLALRLVWLRRGR